MKNFPDIVEFCKSEEYLNWFDNYRWYDEQMDMLKQAYERLPNGLDKYREIVMVLGRRSGKDMFAVIFALYETAKLLSLPDGPFKHYGIAPGNPIYTMLLSCSSDQARIVFSELKHRIQHSKFFKNKIGKIEGDRIYLKTKEDERKSKQDEGSVIILSGNAQIDNLLGKRIFCLVLNEAAFYKTTNDGLTPGNRVYAALAPATSDFRNKDDSGFLDSKIITVSSPGDEDHILYKMVKESKIIPRRIVFQKPTWEVNKIFTQEYLRSEFKFMSDEDFNCEFGAVFRKSEVNKTVSIRLSSHQINVLKKIAREKAFTQDAEISYIDLIRESVEEKYFNKPTE